MRYIGVCGPFLRHGLEVRGFLLEKSKISSRIFIEKVIGWEFLVSSLAFSC